MLESGSTLRRNHTQECRARIEELIVATPSGQERKRREVDRKERELDARLHQEDVRITADEVTGESGNVPEQAPTTPRRRSISDLVGDSPIRPSESSFPDDRQGKATRRPADNDHDDRATKAARSTPNSDDTWSPNSKRFRGLPRGSSQADYSAWMRDRRPTAYGPETPPPPDQASENGDAEPVHEEIRI